MRAVAILLAVLVGCGQHIVLAAPTAPGASFTVSATGDDVDAFPGDGACATTSGDCTLRAAIQEANALPGPDTVTIPAGTFVLSIPGAAEDAAAAGDLDITDSLVLSGGGADVTMIDGGKLDRILDILGGSVIRVSGVAIENGAAANGGGVRTTSASTTLDLTEVTLRGNSASDRGGGIYVRFSTLTMDKVTVSGNAAGIQGGGVFNTDGPATLTNTTLSGNSAGSHGGGLRQRRGSLILEAVTVTQNSAAHGAGIQLGGSAAATTTSSIFANNGSQNCAGTIASGGYNIDSGSTCRFSQPGDLSNTQPMLGPLADNGGPTMTHALLDGSPAIDANPQTCPPPVVDQRGVVRPQDGDDDTTAACDIGSYERVVSTKNLPPVLAPVGSTSGEVTREVSFTATATDPNEGDELTFSLAGAVPEGASIEPLSGVFSWIPSRTQGPAAYTFAVVVTDNGHPNLSDAETITVTVNGLNTAPTLVIPEKQTSNEGENVSLLITAIDRDLPANVLTWSAAGLPAGLSINSGTGEIWGTIDPNASDESPYLVTATVTDDGTPALSDSASFTWMVADSNRAPVASADWYRVEQGGTLRLPAPGVLANDVDPDGDPMTVSLLTAPNRGTLTFNSDGSFTYRHHASDTASDSFGYQVKDPHGGTSVAHVSLRVVKINASPTPTHDQLTIEEDSHAEIFVLANDSDPDGDPLTIARLTQPSAGTAVATRHGSVLYVPPKDFEGTTSFTYTVADGRDGLATGIVSLRIVGVNDAPVGITDHVSLTSYRAQVIHVLANDRDPDGDRLGIESVSEAEHVHAEINGDGSLTFTPDIDWVGADTLTYVVSDPVGAWDEVTILVEIDPIVLRRAQHLAERFGVGAVPFDSPDALAHDGELVIPVAERVALLVSAFFQSLVALRLPLLTLALAFTVLVGFGITSRPSLMLTRQPRRHWSVVRLDRESSLPVYVQPGGGKVIYSFHQASKGIESSGSTRRSRGVRWLRIDTPNGEGWVDLQYLSEQIDLQAFSADHRPVRMVARLIRQLQTGRNIASLISRSGLIIAFIGPPDRVPSARLATLLGDARTRLIHKPGRISNDETCFRNVAESMLTSRSSIAPISPETSLLHSLLIPTECLNFPYLVLEGSEGGHHWLVFFEYQNGKPRIAGIGTDEVAS